MTNNETKRLKEIMVLASEEAKRLGNNKISPEHLFLGHAEIEAGVGH